MVEGIKYLWKSIVSLLTYSLWTEVVHWFTVTGIPEAMQVEGGSIQQQSVDETNTLETAPNFSSSIVKWCKLRLKH